MIWIVFGLIGCIQQDELGLNEVGGPGTIQDDQGEPAAWTEFYNASSTDRSLEGWRIEHGGTPWDLADLTVPAGGMLVLWLDGESNQSDAHAPFVFSEEGGLLAVTNAEGTSIQDITVPDLQLGSSFGRLPDGAANWQVIDTPSPGDRNGG